MYLSSPHERLFLYCSNDIRLYFHEHNGYKIHTIKKMQIENGNHHYKIVLCGYQVHSEPWSVQLNVNIFFTNKKLPKKYYDSF